MLTAKQGGLTFKQFEQDADRYEVTNAYGKPLGTIQRSASKYGDYSYHFERVALSLSLKEIKAISAFTVHLDESDRRKEGVNGHS